MRPWQLEKHYVQSIILGLLSDFSVAFKGGTYLWFFHGLKRFSEDLDFTATGNLASDIGQYVSKGVSLYGMENELKLLHNNQRSLSFRIIANGPLNTGLKDRCVVYVEISKRERVLDDMIPLRLDTPEYQLPVKRLLGFSLDEVGSEKVRAILTRKKARDIYDLHYLVTVKKITLRLDMVQEKLRYYEKRFSPEEFVQEVASRQHTLRKELNGLIFDHIPDPSSVVESLTAWVKPD